MNHACVSRLMAGCICICVSIYLCISNQQERIELEMSQVCVWCGLMAGCICVLYLCIRLSSVFVYLCISKQERIELEMSQVCVWWPDGRLSVAMQQATNLSNQFEVETKILVLSIF